ncbi:PAS domain S-box protein [Rubrobacter tropicus]|nr:PAS domain S-box protein [Rubrobacter tropicus]
MRNPADDARRTPPGRAVGPESMPFVVFALDADGVFTASDGEGLSALGLEPGEVVGRSAFEMYRGEPGVLENLDRALLGESFSSVVEVGGKAFRCRYDPLRDAAGGVVGAVGLAAEAEEISRSASDVRLKERAMAASSDGIVITDPNRPDDPIVYVNPAFEKMTGYSEAEVLGRNCRFLQGEDRVQPALDELRAALRDGRECSVVLKNYRKDGTPFFNELSVSPVFDGEGHLFNYIGVQKDVTERVRHEEELKESEERFRMTFEAAGVGMAHVAPDGRWLRINGKLAEIVGYPREELLSLTFQDITHPEDLEKDLEHVNRMLLGEIDGYSMEKRYVRKDGLRVWVELTVSALRSGSGGLACFVSVVEDITGRKLAELVSDPLTGRELEVLELVAGRRTNGEIAETLNYSVATVKLHVGRLISKLGVENRARAAGRAVEIGLIPPPPQ